MSTSEEHNAIIFWLHFVQRHKGGRYSLTEGTSNHVIVCSRIKQRTGTRDGGRLQRQGTED